jgi:hypothetical protein
MVLIEENLVASQSDVGQSSTLRITAPMICNRSATQSLNAVAPGPVWTPLIPMSFEPEKVSQFGKDTPEGRPAQPKEMAPIYVFLASEDSSYIVGEVIGATGGTPVP